MSAAGEGLTEPNLYLRQMAQMQTSLATWTKNPERESIRDFYFFTYSRFTKNNHLFLEINK